jgi:hypothetical protein
MLTLWDFMAAGGSICMPREFLNMKVNGGQGTLVLTRSESKSKLLWTANWITADECRQYEFYLKDEMTAQGPRTSPKRVLELAAESLELSSSWIKDR